MTLIGVWEVGLEYGDDGTSRIRTLNVTAHNIEEATANAIMVFNQQEGQEKHAVFVESAKHVLNCFV